jgi:hypothetical protein
MNYVAILIPCHRVIGKDGSLTGYGGRLWRKRLLLELERSGRLPGRDEDSEDRATETAGSQPSRTARAVEFSLAGDYAEGVNRVAGRVP